MLRQSEWRHTVWRHAMAFIFVSYVWIGLYHRPVKFQYATCHGSRDIQQLSLILRWPSYIHDFMKTFYKGINMTGIHLLTLQLLQDKNWMKIRRKKNHDILRYEFRIAIRYKFFMYCDISIYWYIVSSPTDTPSIYTERKKKRIFWISKRRIYVEHIIFLNISNSYPLILTLKFLIKFL